MTNWLRRIFLGKTEKEKRTDEKLQLATDIQALQSEVDDLELIVVARKRREDLKARATRLRAGEIPASSLRKGAAHPPSKTKPRTARSGSGKTSVAS